jgi:hypothetical protein
LLSPPSSPIACTYNHRLPFHVSRSFPGPAGTISNMSTYEES